MIYIEILCKDKKEIFIKSLVAMFKMKNIFLINEKFIKIYYNNKANEHLEVKCTEDFV